MRNIVSENYRFEPLAVNLNLGSEMAPLDKLGFLVLRRDSAF